MVIPHTETPTYVRLLKRAQSAHDELLQERNLLKAIKRASRSAEQQRQFTNLASRLTTALKQLHRVLELKVTTWCLLQMLIEAEGTLWTEEERAMWYKVLGSQEGRGEQALKRRHGLPEGQTRAKGDLIKWVNGVRVLYEEVKNLESRLPNGRFNVQNIQTANDGTSAYADWIDEMYQLQGFGDLERALRRKCIGGEIGASTFKQLPQQLRISILQTFAASRVLPYEAINGTTHAGFVWIPRADFDIAWKFDLITKHGPKYSLRPDYLTVRLLRTLSVPQDRADVTA